MLANTIEIVEGALNHVILISLLALMELYCYDDF
jgi:hypothetical protein